MQETTDVLSELRLRGHRMTPQRRAIVAEIMATRGHISPSDVVQRVKHRLPGVNDSTVYRTLDLLEEIGVLSHAHLGSGPAYHHAGRDDHVHLVCRVCGRTEQLPVDEIRSLQATVDRLTGFLPDFTHFAIAGTCSSCRSASEG
jgi:Fur family ferric uptake transcriptional regulator